MAHPDTSLLESREKTSHGLRIGHEVTAAEEPPRAHAPCDGRVTGSGRSPGSRVYAVVRLPGIAPSGSLDNGSPLTVAGAAPDWHRIPYWPAFEGRHLNRGGNEAAPLL